MRVPHRKVEIRRSNLDDPDYAGHAWGRYWRLMRWMAVFTLSVIVAVLGYIYLSGDDMPIHFYIATGLGVLFATMLAAALMGLVFLSSGTGHDEAIDDRIDMDKEDQQ